MLHLKGDGMDAIMKFLGLRPHSPALYAPCMWRIEGRFLTSGSFEFGVKALSPGEARYKAGLLLQPHGGEITAIVKL